MSIFKQDPESATIAGVSLRCEICHHDRFYHRRAQLHSAVASFIDLEWTGPSAECYVCAKCGYIHWFLPQS